MGLCIGVIHFHQCIPSLLWGFTNYFNSFLGFLGIKLGFSFFRFLGLRLRLGLNKMDLTYVCMS